MAKTVRAGAQEQPAPLRLRVLGDLCVERAGERLALPPSRKTRALLGYLLLEPREHTREQLCALFWDAPDDVRGALRWSLSRLRPLLDDERARRLLADRERVQLAPEGAEVDLQRVQRLCAAGAKAATRPALEEAAALFRGELLEGLELPEAFRFQAWCTAQRESARRLHVRVLLALTDLLSAQPEEALPVARRLTGLEPAGEAGHLRVIQLLSALRRPREALAQYDACRDILRQTLGTAPGPELEAARRALGIGAPAVVPVGERASGFRLPASAGAAAPSDSQSLVDSLSGSHSPGDPEVAAGLRKPEAGSRKPAFAATPLVGRAAELARLQALLQTGAPGKLLLLSGEPGIGKTRLLEELARAARAQGMLVLAGRSYEAEQVRPYGAVVDAIRAAGVLGAASAPVRHDLGALFSELDSGAAPGDRTRLFDAVAALLREAGRSAPVLLLLDDAHWLDDASAALAHYLLRTGQGLPRLVLSARPGELSDNPAASRLVRVLRKGGLLEEVSLEPLDRDGVGELLRTRALSADAAAVHAGSDGNALFALELARALQEGRPALSGGLAEALEARLFTLPPDAQALLPYAAALGRTFAPELLALCAGRPLTDVLESLSALERHGWVRGLADGSCDFAHDLMREAAFRAVPAPRRRTLHAALARTLWSATAPGAAGFLSGQRGAWAGAIARQALLGGEDALAVRASALAARQALALFAADEALAHAGRALPLLAALPREERLRTELELLHVSVHARKRSGRLAGLAQELSRVVLEAEASGLGDVVVEGFHLLSQVGYFGENEQAGERNSLAGAEAARADPDPTVRARALAQAGRCLAQIERDMERARALLDEAAAAAASARVPVTDLQLGRGFVLAFLGEDAAARAQLDEAARLSRESQDHWRETEALFALCRLALERGEGALAVQLAAEVLPVAERMQEGDEPQIARCLLGLSRRLAATEAGREDAEALALFDASAEALLRNEARWRYVHLELLCGELELRAGRTAQAAAALARVRALGPSSESQMRQGRAFLLSAELALANGDAAAARKDLAAALVAPGAAFGARARARVADASARLGLAVSTAPHTVPPTPPP